MCNDRQEWKVHAAALSQQSAMPAAVNSEAPGGIDIARISRLAPAIERDCPAHLDAKTAEIVGVAALVVLENGPHLKNRIRDALGAGCTTGEIEEAVMLASQFSGALAAAKVLRIAGEVFAEKRTGHAPGCCIGAARVISC